MPTGFDHEAPLYDTRRGPPGPREVEALQRVFEGRESLLDVGGGTGRYAAPLAKADFVVTVLDRSRGMLAQARAKGIPRTIRGDSGHLPFRDNTFDGAFFVLLLHLVNDWVGTIHEIGRVTRGPVAAILTVREPDLLAIYTETRAKLGHPTGKLDRGAAALVEMFPPARVENLASVRHAVDARDVLSGIEPVEASPPGVHDAALERVRTTYGSTVLERTETTKIAIWNSEDFVRFVPP